jgi:tRNA-2-methylthio-N6-dimethylallyladenosine synthase
MNAHDSERLAGLLDEAGYQPAGDGETPDVVVFNTCAVRENAADRLYGNLGHLLPQKKKGMQIAVGGCLAQMERTRITQRAPWVDVVYGTHNMASLPALLERARVRHEAQAEFAETLETFPSLLPARRQSAYAAWVAISVGCNNTCTFCIVPSLRGKEKDRRPGDILGEIRALVAEGVLEVTLLGQNVNSYGAEFGDRSAFGMLLRGCGEIAGLERVRFTSPHPRDFTDDVVDAMAQTPNVMHSLHMPLQSGSDRILKAMRRAYRRDRYLAILDRVRASIPDAAITTDIIVGFPGETEEDFEQTLHAVREARFAQAFTFQYSKRPGTPAATMDDQVVAFDNFSTGRRDFLARALPHPRFTLVEGDTADLAGLTRAMAGADLVLHFAANADVRFGTEHPRRDLEQNTIATFNVLEAMRASGVTRIGFSSTGSVYGEAAVIPTPEDAPFPVQTSLYGASKAAAEGCIAAYAEAGHGQRV